MATLSIIHLSDIHIKNYDDIILTRAIEISQACASSIKTNAKVVIVVSGDIAFSGTSEQYLLASNFFNQIKDYLIKECNAQVEFVLSPGNHDCDFSTNNVARDTLINNVIQNPIDSAYVNIVTNIQNNYFNFVSEYCDLTENRLVTKKTISFNQEKVLFISVNSAWMSELKEHPGKLIIPKSFLPSIDTKAYKAVIYVFHHPLNWLNPDYKAEFIDHLRSNADIVLLGHEHYKDNYKQIGSEYELIYNHGKELQNAENVESGFSIISFDDQFGSFNVKDYLWDNDHIYFRTKNEDIRFERNKAGRSVFSVNDSFIKYIDDLGVDVRHFAKENITLNDLFLWPDLNKSDYKNEKSGSIRITENLPEELRNSKLSIIIGESTSGKTTLGKQFFRNELNLGRCSILIDGQNFTTSTESAITKVIENAYKKQYSPDYIEEYRQLSRQKKTLIIDNFDSIQNKNNRRSIVIDCVSNQFDSIVILMSSSIEITSLLKSELINSMDELYYYEIRPFGNKKRKDYISKWYRLNNTSDTEEAIEEKIEQAQHIINQFLGNGASFIPAFPLILIGILQNKDAFSQSIHMSKYGYLYESLINQSLASIEEYGSRPGLYNLDTEMLSELAYKILCCKNTFITKADIETLSQMLCREKLLPAINVEQFINRMSSAKVFSKELSLGEGYKFNYPYIFYYFAAKYIANHLNDTKVQDLMEHMSSNLHNETYGNVVTFVCHFNSDQSVIDNVMVNAYGTLDDFTEFDYSKENPIFNEIKNAVRAFIPKKISSNDNVESNKDEELQKMDKIGLNDGAVSRGEDYIDDTVSDEDKNFAAIVAALKTIEVLGQILQNYPADISGQNKVQIINEIHNLGMRSVEAIIETMGYLENDLIDVIYESSVKRKTDISRAEIESHVRMLMNVIVAGMARAMIHQIAKSLSSELLLPSVEVTYKDATTISTQLLMVDLKLNCLNVVNYNKIKQFRDLLENKNEYFAKGVLDSIVGRYLNYNKCDFRLRSRLCSLCGFSEKPLIASSSKDLMLA